MTFKLFSRITNAFEELCLGVQDQNQSLPVVLSGALTVSGGVIDTPAIGINLLTGDSDWFEVGNDNSFSLQIQTSAGITAGALIFEQTNDIVRSPNGNTLPAFDGVSTSGNLVSTLTLAASTARIFNFPAIAAKYIKIRVSTAVVGGNVSAVANFSQLPFTNSALAANAQIAAGTQLVGDVGLQARNTTGGVAAPYRLLSSAANNNAAVVKGSAGKLLLCYGLSATATTRYLKFYNKASAPAPATDTPVVTFAIKGNDKIEINLTPYGQFFSTGIGVAIVAGSGDTDNTAIASGDILGLNIWFV
jgi:hypothetical protein